MMRTSIRNSVATQVNASHAPRYGAIPIEELLVQLDTTAAGLTSAEAASRLAAMGRRPAPTARVLLAAKLFASQFRSPITLILIAAAILSIFLEGVTDAAIILTIVAIGAVLGFWQEFSAANALAALIATVTVRVTVLRDGREVELPSADVVPGDVVVLSAGSSIPADCRLLEAQDLFAHEAALTGESFPVEKQPGQLPADLPLAARTNVLFQGSHVVSGTARAVVVRTGEATELGRIGSRLRVRPPETEFERGTRRFGYLLLEVTLFLVLAIFVIHLALRRPALDALLFALALAVGLTPQLLPAVISVNLAQGARRLAACKVIVRRLASIENFGSMTVLCCDKTGTLTEGTVSIQQCVDYAGQDHPKALRLAALNAALETGFTNPIDEALRRQVDVDNRSVEKLDEIPYDFLRKRLSVLARVEGRRLLIVKGALASVTSICTEAEAADGQRAPLESVRGQIDEHFQRFGAQGNRVLAVAYREHDRDRVTRADETAMTFAGLLVLHDPPREGIRATVRRLWELGVQLKIVTGDNRVVAASIAAQVGLDGAATLTGSELRTLSDEALLRRTRTTNVFAEIEPNQKERIVLAIKRSGEVVGYVGDGINDATALHAADVGISVDQAVDVAKEAADIVLLEHDLDVLCDGVREGRATFVNTLKYVFLATSANFGNMFSMAGLSLFLPYLPLLPKQILLTNLLTDLPEMTIARDHVDQALMDRPQRWDVGLIRRFMVVFGALSSVFDYATFGVLLGMLHAGMDEFRTGWFVESVVSACAVVLIIRSRQPLWTSRPAALLVVTTLLVISATLLLPYLPLAERLGFTPLPPSFIVAMLALVAVYGAAAEIVKRWFFRKVSS